MRQSPVLALCALALAASGCARKHHRPRPLPPPPLSSPKTPHFPTNYSESGLASWYGVPYHGRPTSSGELYDMDALTAAHRTLPFGSLVRVTNPANHRHVEVRINDRGPFIDNRIIDLSRAAARVIDLIRPGVAPVHLNLITSLSAPNPDAYYVVQFGTPFSQHDIDRLRSRYASRYPPFVSSPRASNSREFILRLARTSSEAEAQSIADALRPHLGPAFVVRIEPQSGSRFSPRP